MNAIASSVYFNDAVSRYDDARKRYYLEREKAITLREDLFTAEAEGKDIEAVVIANAGAERQPIDGKNAETREAQLRLILAGVPRYRAAVESVAFIKKEIALAELRADDAGNEMSLAKRRMDRSIQEISLAAAVEANAGIEGVKVNGN